MGEVCNDERKEYKYLYSEIFYGSQKLHKYCNYLRVRGTSALICLYIGELRNGRKSKWENKPLIVFILILRRACFLYLFFLIQFDLTAVGVNST